MVGLSITICGASQHLRVAKLSSTHTHTVLCFPDKHLPAEKQDTPDKLPTRRIAPEARCKRLPQMHPYACALCRHRLHMPDLRMGGSTGAKACRTMPRAPRKAGPPRSEPCPSWSSYPPPAVLPRLRRQHGDRDGDPAKRNARRARILCLRRRLPLAQSALPQSAILAATVLCPHACLTRRCMTPPCNDGWLR